VPAEPTEVDGRIMLVKDCPSCGHTQTLISGSAERYSAKRSLDSGFDHKGCAVNCLECEHRKKPTFVFVDLTNRCNMNCPICINNTPSMGFVFEPPLEYFEKIFDDLATYEETPALQMFGGEPTMRDDLFEIISMAQARGLPVRVVTNGMKLADMDYCRRLVETKSTILIAYDGANPETYGVLRAHTESLDVKLKALDNIAAIGGAKVALMTCMASGFNDREMPELLRFCHDRRDYIRGVYFMPLAHTWSSDDLDLDPPRITGEDIEAAVAACFPEDGATFAPAGAFCEIPTLMDLLNVKPPPFRGAHPNCESMYVLVSDGERYVPLSHYLKGTMQDLMRGLYGVEERLAKRKNGRLARILSKVGLGKAYLSLSAFASVTRELFRQGRPGRVFRGRGLGKLWHILALATGFLFRRRSAPLMRRHTRLGRTLQLIVLPFEDRSTLETDRLERCPNAFAFWDPETDRVRTIPVCAWSQHKKTVLQRIAAHYSHGAPMAAGAEA
jgi:uncharacterized radical SAM superfamily Fe-S cluster-containing enzyme